MTGRAIPTVLSLTIILTVVGCVGNEGAILMAPGSYGDIAIVASSDELAGALRSFTNELNREYSFVIAREMQFNIDVFEPARWELCKGYKNVILVAVLPDGGPVVKALKKHVSSDEYQKLATSAASMLYLEEPFANYQFAVVVAGRDRNSVLSLLHQHADDLRQVIENKAAARIMRRYRVDGLDSNIMTSLWNKDHFFLEVPNVYHLNQDRPDGFSAVELMQNGPSRGLTVSWREVDDPVAVLADTTALLTMREAMGRELHDEELVPETFVWTEDTIGDMRAVKLEGAWSSTDKNFFGGGPFWSWFVADPGTRRLFCLDALCYAPGLDKMDMFRRMRAILETFSLKRPQP